MPNLFTQAAEEIELLRKHIDALLESYEMVLEDGRNGFILTLATLEKLQSAVAKAKKELNHE